MGGGEHTYICTWKPQDGLLSSPPDVGAKLRRSLTGPVEPHTQAMLGWEDYLSELSTGGVRHRAK